MQHASIFMLIFTKFWNVFKCLILWNIQKETINKLSMAIVTHVNYQKRGQNMQK
jgi:hypothetical protein